MPTKFEKIICCNMICPIQCFGKLANKCNTTELTANQITHHETGSQGDQLGSFKPSHHII